MNHTSQYRTGLPHHLHHNQGPALQTFAGRFPPTNLDGVNAVMIPTIGHEDQVQYHAPIQPFHSDRHSEQQLKLTEQRKSDRNFALPSNDCERQENCQENYKPTTSTPSTENQFPQHCSQGSKNCLQCYKSQSTHASNTNNNNNNNNNNTTATTTPRTKIMVDVATMTDAEEPEQTASWQNVSVPPNTKVAEYLSSLRQFLKLSTPTEGKRKLGDVRIVTSPDGSRLYCCPECHMAYPDKSLLEPHLATHKIERRFVCGVCGAGLKRKEHLDRHQLSHSDDRPYSCAACPKTFKRNEHLARHYIVHSGEKAQVCTECGKAFYRKDHLRKHAQGHLTKRLRAAATVS